MTVETGFKREGTDVSDLLPRFSKIIVNGTEMMQTNPGGNSTLTIAAGAGVALAVNDTTDTLTISAGTGAVTFAEIQSRPTTITGFGITDAYTKAEMDASITSLRNGTTTGVMMADGFVAVPRYGGVSMPSVNVADMMLAFGTNDMFTPMSSNGHMTFASHLTDFIPNSTNLEGGLAMAAGGLFTPVGTVGYVTDVNPGGAPVNTYFGLKAGSTWTFKGSVAGSWIHGPITTDAEPTLAAHLATRGYVDSVAMGLSVKPLVKAASVFPTILSSPGAAFDGVSFSLNDRVLIKNQAIASQNGIYVYNGASSALTRTTDFDGIPAEEIAGSFVFVEQGITNGGTGWVITGRGPFTIGTTPLVFEKFSSAISSTVSWSLITNKPTTLTGYGITDAFTQALADARYSQLSHTHAYAATSHSHSWDDVATNRPTTLSGYGITDAYTKTQTDTAISAVNPANISGTTSPTFQLNTGSSGAMIKDSSGRLQARTAGDTNFANMDALAFFTQSKRSEKEGIKSFAGNATGLVLSTEVVQFTFISDPEKMPRVGFVADDTDPLLSGPNQDKMDLNNTIGVLLKAFQELSSRCDQLESEVAALKAVE